LASAAALGLAVAAVAFPPTPPHRVRGMLRNEMGDPLNNTNAVVLLETLNGVRVKSAVVPNLGPGRNYSVSVPMDAGATADNYKATALRAATSYRMKVQIGAVTYLPLETAVNTATLGGPTQVTQMDLTLGEDSDGDGLPDAWERALLASLGRNGNVRDVRPGDDDDGDGINNLNEYRAGTYAFDKEDGFRLDVVEKGAEKLLMKFLAIPGRRYALSYSEDLKAWKGTGFRLSTDAAGSGLRGDFVATRTTLLRVEVPTTGVPEGAFFRATVQ
jgi:hypothetical protein